MTTPSHIQDPKHLAETLDKLHIRLSSIKPSCLEQLDGWRDEAYQLIDQYYKHKRHELIEEKQTNEEKHLEKIRKDLNKLIAKHDNQLENYEAVHHEIQLAEVRINELEHFRLTAHPLSINDHLIVGRHLFPLPHPHRTINLKAGPESAVGTNEKHLLVDREGKYLCLIDRKLNIVQETPFTHDGMHGVCWSSTIGRFIIITFKEILLLDEKTMTVETCPISSKIDWWRGTCSDDKFYLSTVAWGSSIFEFDLHSSFKLIKEWHQPTTCRKEEIICDLKYNSGFIAIPIYNRQKSQSRLDLRSAETFDCIWSVHIHGRCRCCSFDVDQWLVMDHDDCRFFHISADGKLLEVDKYDQAERLEDIVPWGKDTMIVLTKKHIHMHTFK